MALALRLLLVLAFVRQAGSAQVALAAGRDAATSATVTWITDEEDDSCSKTGYVEVSIPQLPTSPVRTIFGNCTRYEYGSIAHGNYTSGLIHKALMSGLAPRTVYAYSLHSGFNGTFQTLPEGSSYPVAFGVLGDIGQSADSRQTIAHLSSDSSLGLLLHAGDMAYADTDGKRWDSYGELISGLSSRLQWMVAPGNHEVESDTFTGMEFVPYESRYAMPAVADPVSLPNEAQKGCAHYFPYQEVAVDCTPSAHRARYDFGQSFYSFDAGPVHVAVLNTYTAIEPGSAQREWFEADLAAVDSAARPWTVVMSHGPMYNSNQAHTAEWSTLAMRNELEPVFRRFGVALSLMGHVHAYERSHPVYLNKTDADRGVVYITCGDGGNREGHAQDFYAEPEWSAFRNGTDFGHGKLQFANETHAQWEWFVNDLASEADIEARGMTGTELPLRVAQDSVWFLNPKR